MIVNKLVTLLTYRVDKRGATAYERQLREVQRQAERSTRNMTNVFSRASAAIGRMLKFSMKIYGIDNAKRELSGVEKSIGKLGGQLKALAVGYLGLQALQSGAGFVKNTAFDYETVIARLTTLEGSAEAAKKRFNFIAEFAKDAPTAGLIDSANLYIELTNQGMTVTKDIMYALGDLSDASGRTLNDMTEAIKSSKRGQASMIDNFVGMGGKIRQEDGTALIEVSMVVDPKTKKELRRTLNTESKTFADDLLKFYVDAGKRAHIAGGMKRKRETTPGMVAAFGGQMEMNAIEMWEAGLKKPIQGLMEQAIKYAEMLEAPAKRFGAGLGKLITEAPGAIKDIAKYAPIAASGIGLIAAHLVGLKVMALFASGGAGLKFLGFLKVIGPAIRAFIGVAMMAGPMATLTTVFGALGAALMPLLIGGALIAAVSAIAALGWTLWQYWQNGDKALEGIRAKFPALADGIKFLGDELKAWWPHLQAIGKAIWSGIIGAFHVLWPLVKWAFEKIIIPYIVLTIKWWAQLAHWIRVAYEAYMPALVKAFYFWKDAVRDIWSFLEPKIKWLIDRIKELAGLAGNAFNGVASLFGGGDSSGPGATYAGLGQSAAEFIRSGRGDQLAKLDPKGLFKAGVACNYLVNQLLKANGATQELQQQLTDRVPDTYKNLIRSGMAEIIPFSQARPGDLAFANNFGHIGMLTEGGKLVHAANSRGHEIGRGQRPVIDNNYMGAGGHYLRIKSQHLGTGSMPNPGGSPGAGNTQNNVNQTLIFNGPADPNRVSQGAASGLEQGLNRIQRSRSRAAPPRR